jgi:hypothetical protein
MAFNDLFTSSVNYLPTRIKLPLQWKNMGFDFGFSNEWYWWNWTAIYDEDGCTIKEITGIICGIGVWLKFY